MHRNTPSANSNNLENVFLEVGKKSERVKGGEGGERGRGLNAQRNVGLY